MSGRWAQTAGGCPVADITAHVCTNAATHRDRNSRQWRAIWAAQRLWVGTTMGDGLTIGLITGLCKRTPITLAGPMLATCWCSSPLGLARSLLVKCEMLARGSDIVGVLQVMINRRYGCAVT
jgi:hypothetical protein